MVRQEDCLSSGVQSKAGQNRSHSKKEWKEEREGGGRGGKEEKKKKL
jgi:hypothetical protein